MDAFLDFLGLYRSDVAKDGSCLFRAVSEQLFYTQVHHVKLRSSCVQYIIRNRDLFEPLLNEDFDVYIEKIKDSKEWAGELEMNALSKQYRIDFLIYHENSKNPTRSSSGVATQTVTLSCNDGNRYDCVYAKSELQSLAFCQSIVYEVLYKDVFNLGSDVDMAVEKMLHDKAYSKQRRNNLLNHMFRESCRVDDLPNRYVHEEDESEDPHLEIRRALAQGIPPFPYKVAKTLDPGIYRNVEFDLWNELRKGDQKTEQFVIPKLEPGVKCKVHFNKDIFTGHIQDVHNETNEVTVYIEELCKRCVMSNEVIEVIPVPAYKALTWQGGKTYKVYTDNNKPNQDKFKGRRYYKKSYQELSSAQSENVTPSKAPLRSNSFSAPGDRSTYNRCGSFQSPKRSSRKRVMSHSITLSNAPPKTSPQQMTIAGSYSPQVCSTPNYPAMWSPVDQMMPTSPISIPGNIPNSELYRKMSGSPESLNELNPDSGWTDDILPPSCLSYMPPQPYSSPHPMPDQPLYANTGANSPEESTASSPLPIPNPRGMEESGYPPMQPSTPTILYQYPVYTNMYLVCRDGSTLPVSVAPWGPQDAVQSGEILSGSLSPCPQYAPMPSVYFNTPPSGVSPPMTQWVHGPVTNFGTTWTPSATAVGFSPPIIGEMGAYHQSMMSPPWSPQSSILVAPPMAYPVTPPPQPPMSEASQQN